MGPWKPVKITGINGQRHSRSGHSDRAPPHRSHVFRRRLAKLLVTMVELRRSSRTELAFGIPTRVTQFL